MKDQYIYVKEHRVLLEYIDNIGYEPILYEAEEIDGQFQGKIVSDNKMLSTWLMFLRKMRTEYDMTGNRVYRNLYYNQHSYAINALVDIQECNNSKWMVCTGRQFGKSTISEHITLFTFIFMPLFSKRFFKLYNIILASYNAVTTEKLFAPIRQKLPETIEIFNQMFYPLEIITKSSILNLENTKDHVKLGIIKNGNEEEYSQIYALGADSKHGRDSMTANLLILDEHTKVDMFGNGNFGASYIPMTNATSGVLLSYGITSSDPSCVGYNLYINEKVKKFIAGWEKVYHNKLMNSVEEGEGYKQASLDFRDLMGENSTEWLTNYVMTFDVLEGKFLSPKLIKDNNLMRTVWESPNWTNPDKYIVGGLDLSSITDRTVLYIMESELQNKIEDRWISETKEIIVYNINKTSLDADKIINDTVSHCISRKLDILLVDATGMQRVIVNSIMNEASKQNCKTLIIPYDFSGNKKWYMFQHLEQSLYSQRCLLPKWEYLESYREVQLMYDELICLIKEKPSESSSHTKFYAPSGKTDDICCAMAMSNFATTYVRMCELERKEITLGKYKFIPRLKKAQWQEEKKQTPITNWLWM